MTTDLQKAREALRQAIIDEIARTPGHSAATLGRMFGKTRNAMMGFCHRQGIKLPGGRDASPSKIRPKKFKVTMPVLVSTQPVLEESQEASPPIATADRFKCKWPNCPFEIVRGSYCAEHGAMVYVKPEKRVRI